MTVPANSNTRTQHVGNGISTSFDFDFLCLEARDLSVSVDGDPVPESAYSVSGLGNAQGGTVTFLAAPADQTQILLELAVVTARDTNYADNGDLFADTLNPDFDRLWLALKNAFGNLTRALQLGMLDADGSGSYRANGNRIQNLGAPQSTTDAVRKQDVTEALANLATDGSGQFVVERLADVAASDNGAAMVAFRQLGTGAQATTLQRKSFYYFDVMDFIPPAEHAAILARTSTFDCAPSLNLAAAACVAYGKQELRVPGGRFPLKSTFTIPAGLMVVGAGRGEWHIDADVSGLPQTVAPTEFMLTGTGPKVWTQKYVTDMRTAGGVVENPSSLDANDSHYRLTSFTNEDGTLRAFSVGIKTERSGRGAGLRNCRVIINNDGIDGYNDTGSTSLGDDWDVGFWNECGEHTMLDCVDVVGMYRIAGYFQTCLIDNDQATSGYGLTGSQFSRARGCTFQGAVGALIRGGDTYRITEVDTGYIGIEDAPNLPFKSEVSGTLRAGSGENTSSVFTYTGVSVVGDNLRLAVTGSTAGLVVGGMVIANVFGFGLSNTSFENCVFAGLSHPSKKRATKVGLTKPSAELEVSGSFVRGIAFKGCKFISIEDVHWHLHNCTDLTFDEHTLVEARTDAETGTAGGRVIASLTPASNTRVPNPSGQTDRIKITMGASVTNRANDFRPYNNRQSAPDRYTDGSDTGFFQPQSCVWVDLQFPFSTTNAIMRPSASGALILQDDTGNSRVTAFTNNGTLSLSGGGTTVQVVNTVFRPSVDAAVNLGQVAFRWLQVYAANATISTSDERLKSEIEAVSNALLDAWQDVRWVMFRRVGGDRLHMGLIAQEVIRVFQARGLDAMELALVCHDSWDAEPAVLDPESGDVVQVAREAGDLYGLRYEHALVLEAALNRRRLDAQEARIAALEAKVGG